MRPTQTVLVATDLSARSDRPMERALLLRDLIRDEFRLSIILNHGSVPTVIAEVAKQRDCSIVITGLARFNSPRDYVFGTAVDYLVRRSPAPVLVVKRRARRWFS